MTNREKEILDYLRKHPMASQKDCAHYFGISRSSAAVHIANLTAQGAIMGRGYILKTQPYAVVIGGANMDIQGFPSGILRGRDSNPGSVRQSCGGVARNIAENLGRLGADVRFVSAVGGDLYGRQLLEATSAAGVHVGDVLIEEQAATSTYLSILDEHRDMALALADMEVLNRLTPAVIEKKAALIQNAAMLVLDTNLTRETLEYCMDSFPRIPIFLDTVSGPKSEKVRDLLDRVHTLKPNRAEAEILLGREIKSDEDARAAINGFLDRGLSQVFLSLGESGVAFGDSSATGILTGPEVDVKNATGAGDAFLAGAGAAFLQNLSVSDAARWGTAAAHLTLQDERTINTRLSAEYLTTYLEETTPWEIRTLI